MILSEKTALLFSGHLVLLAIKVWFFFKIIHIFNIVQAPKKEKFILLFEKIDVGLVSIAIISLVDEFHYLSTFFYRAIPHSYKYIEIIGIIYLMIYIVHRLQKEK